MSREEADESTLTEGHAKDAIVVGGPSEPLVCHAIRHAICRRRGGCDLGAWCTCADLRIPAGQEGNFSTVGCLSGAFCSFCSKRSGTCGRCLFVFVVGGGQGRTHVQRGLAVMPLTTRPRGG